MLRKFVCVAVALALVAGVAEAAKGKKKTKGTTGTLVKCDAEKGIICILVKKDKDDEGTKTEFKITDETKFMEKTGKKATPVAKDDLKEKLKEGAVVTVILDEEGKTATSVIIGGGKKKKEKEKE